MISEQLFVFFWFTNVYMLIQHTHVYMKSDRGIRVPEELKNKIKRAALKNKMSMAAYLDSIVPEIKMEEVE